MYICLPSLSPIGLSARLNILPVMSVCDLTWSLTDANLVDYFELTKNILNFFCSLKLADKVFHPNVIVDKVLLCVMK